ncbi:hypothetical protein L1049_012915 [Liquidambar formosana]|uniref:Uncharacterized protein n=1 Tax=Liquidambar formosana TaxID=63359 RepID=A0AAP0RJP2_LIQFO
MRHCAFVNEPTPMTSLLQVLFLRKTYPPSFLIDCRPFYVRFHFGVFNSSSNLLGFQGCRGFQIRCSELINSRLQMQWLFEVVSLKMPTVSPAKRVGNDAGMEKGKKHKSGYREGPRGKLLNRGMTLGDTNDNLSIN